MNPGTRACVAYVAGSLISGGTPSAIYDYSRSRHVNISGTVDQSNVNIYDHERSCHFGGSLPSLYDYGRNCHVSLEVNGSDFSGYDYGDSVHFSGSVSGNAVSLYDYGESQHFSYSL